MKKLLSIVRNEQPKLNELLDKITDEMPTLSRPVAKHILLAGGKRLRPILSLMMGRLCGKDSEDLYTVGLTIELIHAATLLHDDIMDNAATRRGQPTAHTLFPVSHVILAGDVMLAKAMDLTIGLENHRLNRCLARAVISTAEGQIAESSNLRNISLSYEDYLEIITGKTAWLLRVSSEIGALASGADDDMVEAAADFGLELGIAFQLVDDALDYSPAKKTGKPSGGDLLEGKMTPPLYFYMQSLEAGAYDKFQKKFVTGTFSHEEVKELCPAIYAKGGRKTREMAEEHVKKAELALAKLPDTAERKALEGIGQYIISRSK